MKKILRWLYYKLQKYLEIDEFEIKYTEWKDDDDIL